MTEPLVIKRRSLPEQLRYIAGKLQSGEVSVSSVVVSLYMIADEQEQER